MSVLIGIPTHKRPHMLRACLESIAGQKGNLPKLSVFVGDNDAANAEGTAMVEGMARDYCLPLTAKVVAQPGISAVRNAILDEARRQNVDFIAMIDDDETAPPEWIANLLAIARNTDADVIGGPTEPVFESEPTDTARHYWAPRIFPEGPISIVVSSANLLISARGMARLDWPRFDDAFGMTGGGDTEWFRRIASCGASFAWAPKAMTLETVPPDRATTKWVLKRYFRAGNHSTRINIVHGASGLVAKDIALSLARLVAVPILLIPLRNKRWWLIKNWFAAAGSLSALGGYVHREYAERH